MKYVGIRLEDDEYRMLDSARAAKNINSIQDSVREAIKEWSSGRSGEPWASLNQTERNYLLTVLRYVREEPHGLLIPTLRELVKRRKPTRKGARE